SLIMSSLFMYSSLDFLWWVAIAYFTLRLINSGDGRWWLALGLVFGLGLMTRYTIAICAVSLLVGVLATPLRRQLLTPWPWAGAVTTSHRRIRCCSRQVRSRWKRGGAG